MYADNCCNTHLRKVGSRYNSNERKAKSLKGKKERKKIFSEFLSS